MHTLFLCFTSASGWVCECKCLRYTHARPVSNHFTPYWRIRIDLKLSAINIDNLSMTLETNMKLFWIETNNISTHVNSLHQHPSVLSCQWPPLHSLARSPSSIPHIAHSTIHGLNVPWKFQSVLLTNFKFNRVYELFTLCASASGHTINGMEMVMVMEMLCAFVFYNWFHFAPMNSMLPLFFVQIQFG